VVWLVRLCFLGLAVALSAAAGAARADYPSKSIRIIVPFPPGAFNDQLARVLSQHLGERWGQPVVVDNRPGGSTVIGTDLAAKAAPDGHTLLIVSFAFAVNPSLISRLPYDTLGDFTPVVLAAATPNLLLVNPAIKAGSLKELLALARSDPQALHYATAGYGTSAHLCMERLKLMAHVDITHIAYKGSAPALTDLIGGQVQVMFDNVPNALPHVKAGKLRALAVTSAQRTALLPELPTFAEAGVSGYETEVWFGVVAPAGTPKEIVAKLNGEINRILALPEVKRRFADQGVRVIGGPPERFAAHLRAQTQTWAKVVQDADLRMD
jgi:tripartite-type tricarboxylate transporter receptor subunit TctC